jgi:hypothetical protein
MMRIKWTGDVTTPLDGADSFFDYLIMKYWKVKRYTKSVLHDLIDLILFD